MIDDVTSEQKALLLLLSNAGAVRAEVQTIDWGGLDWEGLLATLDSNLFSYLHASCEEHHIFSHLPLSAKETLNKARLATRLRHLRRSSELKRIASSFAEYDIPCLVLKGADLACRLYRDPSCRPMRDVDLLVQEQDLEKAQTALNKVEYFAPFDPDDPLRQKYLSDNLLAKTELSSIHNHLSTLVDRPAMLNEKKFCKILNSGYLGLDLKCVAEPMPGGQIPDWDARWARSQIHSVETNNMMRVLEPTDLLVQLSVHAVYRHGCESGLLWLLDLRLLLEKWGEQIDWDRLWNESMKDGSAQTILLALHLVNGLFSVRVEHYIKDNVIKNKLPEGHLEQMCTLAWHQLFDARLEKRPPITVTLAAAGDYKGLLQKVRLRMASWFSRNTGGESGGKYPLTKMPARIVGRVMSDTRVAVQIWMRGDMDADVLKGQRVMDERVRSLRSLLF